MINKCTCCIPEERCIHGHFRENTNAEDIDFLSETRDKKQQKNKQKKQPTLFQLKLGSENL